MMNCKKYKAQIEELIGEQPLPTTVLNHLNACVGCRAFRRDRQKLTQMLQGLQTVSAPADFDFRVKARLREQETNAPAAHLRLWLKFTLLAPTALAILIIGFVFTKSFAPLSNAPQELSGAVSPTTEIVQPSMPISVPPTAIAVAEIPQTEKNNQTVNRFPAQSVAQKLRKTPVVFREKRTLTGSPNLRKENEGITSKDSAVTGAAPSIMPRGFSDPLVAPRKQNGKDLLQTFGVEIIFETDNFRVTSVKPGSQAAKAGLVTGDIIEKINNENPTAISGGEFKEITLNVRRQNRNQEIKIVPKP